jgi:RNA polymerase sigma-70 factor, ECF subfamily
MTVVALPPFWSLVEDHGDELLAHAKRLAGPEQAEDVVQEALLKALRAYPRLRHGDHLRAWLYRIVTNCAVDAHRRGARELPEPEAGVDVGVEDPEHLDGFEDLIGDLTAPARDALRLRFVDDLSYEAIAAELAISPAAARQRVSTAIRTLRQRIPA